STSLSQLRVVGPDQPLTATVGQDVVLPCHLSPQRDARSLDVRWIRDEFSETVHHYRNGEDLYGEQMEAYAGRTELARDDLSAGSLDVRITMVRPSDDGLYLCSVGDADAYHEVIVELEVSEKMQRWVRLTSQIQRLGIFPWQKLWVEQLRLSSCLLQSWVSVPVLGPQVNTKAMCRGGWAAGTEQPRAGPSPCPHPLGTGHGL
uniref:Ig-like domain-containing protein n=1 Tax=Anser brachyrhynchus TaxID=132585 RepID=A0A8B9C0A9_9AVES